MEEKNTMIIAWLGHACFKLEYDGYAIVVDPYADDFIPGLAPLRVSANQVLCSHDHGDHNFEAGVALEGKEASPFAVTEIDTYHDDQEGALRGTNKIHIFEAGDLKVAHLGDLGCELMEDQKEQLKDLDAVMIPVGGFYTIDAVQAKKLVDEIKPRVIIPMHYTGENFGFDNIAKLDPFTDQCDLVVEYPENELALTKETEAHTAVLALKQA